MALATSSGGQLKTLNDNCWVSIPNYGKIQLKILPEISDSKKATYADTIVIGRSTPIKTYLVVQQSDIQTNIKYLWAIESAVYPRLGQNSNPYTPPPVCQIQCGQMLGDAPLCVILDNYNVSFPTNVAWDKDTLLPYYFEVTTSWHVVYATSSGLPNQDKIISHGA